MLFLKCRRCGGTGLIPNEKYELCKLVKSEEARRYFGIAAEDAGDPTVEWVRTQCGPEEMVTCDACDGAGILEFDDEDWELIVVPEEEVEE